jgi:Ca2+/Na+ antiporter
MSFTDHLVLWLHIAFAIFTIGPVTAAIMSTPRYIRKRNVGIVQYLYRVTRIFALVSLGVLIFGLVAAQQQNDFAKPWLTVSITLFVVAFALLLLVMRDQHRAIGALQTEGLAAAAGSAVAESPGGTEPPGPADQSGVVVANGPAEAPDPDTPETAAPVVPSLASVERGRIAMLGGVVSVIWLVILVLMVWNG